MSFQQGLSGLSAAAKQLDVIGNNVANASTVGFKSSRAEFADLYATSLYGVSDTESGIGSQTVKVAQQFQQGSITSTKNPLDMAISGSGFFKLWSDTSATQTYFTRNGQFKLDKDGYFVNNGSYLVGQPSSGGNDQPLQIKDRTLAGEPTTGVDWSFNLDADEKSPMIDYGATPVAMKPVTAIDAADPKSYNFTTSVRVFDTLGGAHTVSLYFQRQGSVAAGVPNVANQWNVAYRVNNNPLITMPTQVQFQSNGSLDPASLSAITIPATGAVDPITGVATPPPVAGQPNLLSEIQIDLAGTTQYSGDFSIKQAKLDDGFAMGELIGLEVVEDGTINAKYSNGQNQSIGRARLYTFDNVQGLQPTGDNNWVATAAAGSERAGFPGEGSYGALQSSALEESNADTTAELINMIVAQRFYQANAQTIKTQDAILQTLLNLR